MLGGGGRVLDVCVCGGMLGGGGRVLDVRMCKVGCWVGEGGYLIYVCVRWDVGWGREGT